MKAPVSLCIIVKNEPLLENCLKSLREFVEEIVIVDTGSTDNVTQEIAKRYADVFDVYTACNNSETGLIEDFSAARQRSFDLATKPWVLWCDADDVIEGAQHLNFIIDDFEKHRGSLETVGFMFPYEYSYDSKGNVTCRHFRERLVYNKKAFKWVNPVHECLVPQDDTNVNFIPREEVVFKHRRQYSGKTPEQGRNLRILKKYIEKVGDSDARQLYYIGLEYCNNGMINEAIESLTKYVSVSGWPDEIAMACLKLVDIYQAFGQYEEGLKWAFKTVDTFENWSEGYFALARMYYFLAPSKGPLATRYWRKCAHFAKLGLSLPPTQTLLFINPFERDVIIHEYLNVALNHIGDVIGARESCDIGLKKDPENKNLLTNKRIYDIWLAKQSIVNGVNKLIDLTEIERVAADMIVGVVNKQLDVSKELPRPLVDQLPSIAQKPVAASQRKKTVFDIVFFVGDGVEVWTPDSIKQSGMGGSELMVVEIAKRLAKNHKVRVYSGCGNGEGIYENVEYLKTEKYHDINCDVLVVSRRADMIGDQYNVSANLKLLYVHDIYAIAATSQLLLKYDRILALSDWHKRNLINYHSVHPNQIVVTRNGIDLERFKSTIERQPFKCINSSSPDRSWPILLDIWPQIRAKVPKAELHLFYGFKNWEYSAQSDQLQKDLIERIKTKIREMASLGVVYRDRVDHQTLANEFMSSSVWLYPTWFSETSCISAMEAQAAGTRMITSSRAALDETVDSRGHLIPGEWTSPQYQDYFVKVAIAELTKSDESDREQIRKFAFENFGLDDLVNDWEQMFADLLYEVSSNPLIPYVSLSKK